MNAADQRRLTPLLALLAALLGAVWLLLLLGIGRGVHWSAARPRAALPAAGHPVSLPRPLPLQQFAVVWQKPLFNPDRKPVVYAADGDSHLGNLRLTGIILTPSLRMALLQNAKGDRQVSLREGQSLPDGSVTLVEIRTRSAVFDSSAGRTELKLPNGAPIDVRKASGRPSGSTMMRVREGGEGAQKVHPGRAAPTLPQRVPKAAPPASSPVLDRLRKTIQKRRAEKAAEAAHQGVR